MSLRHAVLGLLAREPGSGYDLMKLFDDSLRTVWPATQSQLYGELSRLADAGLVRVGASGGRGRKEYSITDAGRTELRTWLLSGPSRGARSEMLLRLCFLGQVEPAEARAYLRHQAELAAKELAELEAVERLVPEHGRLAFELGLRHVRVRQEWAAWAEERLAESVASMAE
ncbi:MAG: PadR family transcriptional regulator [Thermoactinospora sp.]|nr:PadR family transcriptional regulator [Thermoactinospora sp.]